MDEIIYILIGVAYFAYYIYKGINKNKSKKEGENASIPRGERKPKSELETIFEELIGGKTSNNTPHPYEDTVEEYQKMEVIEAKFEEKAEKKSTSKYDRMQVLDSFEGEGISMLDDEFDSQDEDIQHEALDFDLQQAVIFSEILKRPYA